MKKKVGFSPNAAKFCFADLVLEVHVDETLFSNFAVSPSEGTASLALEPLNDRNAPVSQRHMMRLRFNLDGFSQRSDV